MTFQQRLKDGMRMRGLKAADLVRMTGISSARISQYINGKYEAKQNAVAALSRALNVSEAWLMGFDAPIERNDRYIPTHEEVARVALFGGDTEVTDEMWEEVRQFAEFVKAKHKQRRTDDENADK